MYREPKNIESWQELTLYLVTGAPADDAATPKTGANYGERHEWKQRRCGAEPICQPTRGLKAAFWA